MVNIKGFPLLHEEECKEMFSADMSFSGYYFMKPIYKWLPDFSDLDDEEKAKYIEPIEITEKNLIELGFNQD